MPAHSELIAIDIDGTLLNSAGKVSAANIRAIETARAAGLKAVVCTGRGLVECRHVLEQIAHDDPAVVAGGCMIACPQPGRTLHRVPMSPDLVRDMTATITAHGHAALILKDPHAAGYDYLVITPEGGSFESVDPVSRWWFNSLGVRVRTAPSLDLDPHPEHTVRVGLCSPRSRSQAVAQRFIADFADRTCLHHFPAIVPSTSESNSPAPQPPDPIVILEAFDRRADKWTGIQWLAASHNIPLSRVAAIGDQINDLPMLRGAALSIAMGNAVPEARAAASRHTLDNDSDGVAHAIHQILAGAW